MSSDVHGDPVYACRVAGLSVIQQRAVEGAIASGAIEGWNASPDDVAMLAGVARGEVDVRARATVLRDELHQSVQPFGTEHAVAEHRPTAGRRWTWADYLYPGTSVLVNRLDIREHEVLQSTEGTFAAARAVEVSVGHAAIGTSEVLDADYLRRLHHWIAQDVFDWAGTYRHVPMTKGYTAFAAVEHIDSCVAKATTVIAQTDWSATNDQEFAERAAVVFCWLNLAHPFRDLNGRATRLFMDAVAGLAGRELDCGAVRPAVWLQRSAFSVPDSDQAEPQHRWMVPVFATIATDIR